MEEQQLKSLYNATLNPSLSPEDKGHLLGVLATTPKFYLGNLVLVYFHKIRLESITKLIIAAMARSSVT